jgi:Anthrone oxygenase
VAIQIVAVVVLGLMCGSELSVAAFAHTTFNRQPMEAHVRLRASFAALLGRVMPFWMSGSTVLNLLLLLPFEHLSGIAWRLTVAAFAIQVLAVVFSLLGPVPINNRIAKWTPESIPDDWRMQEHRWDVYHWSRTFGLIAAFVMLVLSVGLR